MKFDTEKFESIHKKIDYNATGVTLEKAKKDQKNWFYIINYLEWIIQWVVLYKVPSGKYTLRIYLTPKLIPGGSRM